MHSYEPAAILAALSPHLLSIPDRIKAAVFQFLTVIVPHCGTFFSQQKATFAFLGRLAQILGSSGSERSEPSSALLGAGRRLLELVYVIVM